MRDPGRIVTIVSAMLLTGCASLPPPSAVWHRGIVEPESKRLIAFWLLREHSDEPVTIDHDYGMLLVWDEHVRRFYLFNNPAKTYFVTEDFDRFLSELDRLPTDITLDWVDTCTVPRFWKMPQDARQRLSAGLKRANRKTTRTSDQPHIACYCESDGIKLLGAEPAAPLYGARPRGR